MWIIKEQIVSSFCVWCFLSEELHRVYRSACFDVWRVSARCFPDVNKCVSVHCVLWCVLLSAPNPAGTLTPVVSPLFHRYTSSSTFLSPSHLISPVISPLSILSLYSSSHSLPPPGLRQCQDVTKRQLQSLWQVHGHSVRLQGGQQSPVSTNSNLNFILQWANM